MDISIQKHLKHFFLPFVVLFIWLGYMFCFDLFYCFNDGWPIALAMILGSFVAGSTPVGGGTIGYPVMVLFFSVSPFVACDFSLAIQSVGMGMATFFILSNKERIEWITNQQLKSKEILNNLGKYDGYIIYRCG